MSFKSRFALLFSLSVFLILTVTAVCVVVLNEDYREKEFYMRVKDEAFQSSRIFISSGSDVGQLKADLEANALHSLPREQIAIIDSNLQPIHVAPANFQAALQPAKFAVAKKRGSCVYTHDQLQTVIVYKAAPIAHYVQVTAFDQYGHSKAENLQLILFISVLGGLVLSGILALFYVRQITKPLNNLKQQMQRINEENLNERVVIDHRAGELSDIAKNFNDMLDRLALAFEARKSFVQHASHELRTPLANMLSQTEAALAKDLSVEEYHRIFQSLKEDQQDMISLTNSLLLLSQYENLPYLDQWKTMRIDELLYETIDITRTMFRETLISVHFAEVPEDENLLLFNGNELLIKSALQNLIRNGCKYAADDKVNITIIATAPGIRIVFENVGKQILAGEQAKLFIPFFRGENSTNKKGFGLGLSIVQRILSLHKGSVRYEALAGNINRFIVDLPHK